MPLQIPNFLNASIPTPDYSGIANLGNVFENYYKGYEMGQKPAKLARDKLRDEIMNNIFAVKAKYAEPTAALGLQKGQTELEGLEFANMLNQKYGAQKEEAGIGLNKAQIMQALAAANKNNIEAQYKPEEFRNEQDYRKALTEQALANSEDTKADARRKALELELYNSDFQAEGGVPFQLMSPGERNETVKDIRNEQKKAQSLIQVNKIAKEMLELTKQHPNISKQFAAVWAHADENDPTFWNKFTRNIANEKDLAAFQKYRKLASKLISAKGDTMGGRLTDAKLKLIENMKASPGNTDEANIYMLQGEIYDTEPAEAYNKALENGLNKRRRPSLDLEAYRAKKEKVDLNNLPDIF